MNSSWRNSPKNCSTGFVYFNTSNSSQSPNSQNSLDTSDFLSFGSDSSPGGSPHVNHFSPVHYSSPRKHFGRKSPRQWGNRNQYYSPVQQKGGQYWRRNMGLTGSAQGNTNSSNNYANISDSYQHQNRPRQKHMNRHHKSFNPKTSNQSFDSSNFYDPTCLEDPWAELEQKLVEDRKKQEESLVQSKSSQESSPEMDVEVSSDESESEDGSEEMEESFS